MKHAPSLFALTSVMMLCITACDDCSDQKPEVVDLGVVAPEDLSAPDLGDPLKEARQEAEEKAQLVAVTVGDKANLVAAQIEAASAEPTTSNDSGGSSKARNNTPKKEKISGTISAAEANKVFRRYDGGMRKCYERSLKKRPGLRGKVKLSVVVGSSGKVSRVNANSVSLRDGNVNSCMETLAKRMTFPPPKGGAASLIKTYSFEPAL